jgi:pilus assembly protein CpaE
MRMIVAQERAEPLGLARQAVLSLGMECNQTDCVTLADLPSRLNQGNADLALVVLSDRNEGMLNLVRQSSLSRVPILIAGPITDASYILMAMRSSVRAFLDVGQLTNDLSMAVQQLKDSGTIHDANQGLLMVCCAAQPGVGCTTLAINTAFALQESHAKEGVALLEGGGGVPGIAMNLNIDPVNPVSSLTDHWQRLDAIMLRQVMVKHSIGVDVLAHRSDLFTAAPLGATLQRSVLGLLKSGYGYAVADMGHDFIADPALAIADRVVVVTRLDIPTLRLTRRFIAKLQNDGCAVKKLRVVVNRYGQTGQLSWKQAEDALGIMLVKEPVPDDSGACNTAINQGQPLIGAASRAKVTKAFSKLSVLLNGRKP